jgi:hypothetical protein
MSDVLNLEDTKVVEKENEDKDLMARDSENLSNLKEKIRGVLRGGNTHEKHYSIWVLIQKHLKSKRIGSFYDDGNLYFFRNRDKSLMKIDKGQEDTSKLINTEFGLIPSDNMFDNMIKNIRQMAYEFKPKETHLKRSSHYCVKENAVYLSLEKNSVIKITENSVTKTHNGVDDVIFYNNPEYFISDFEYDESIEIDYIVNNALDGNYKETESYTGEEAKRLTNTWLLSFFFPEISQTRMIMVAYGEHGSFKTFFTQRLGWIVKGSKFNVSSHDEKTDLDNVASNKTFVAFDNIETRAKTGFLDQLARIATGTSVLKRTLYVTNEIMEFPVQVNMCISSMKPTFRRPDVVERLLLVEMEKKDDEGYLNYSDLKKDFLDNRDKCMSCVVNQIKHILKEVRLNSKKESYTKSRFRMADFATLLKYREGNEKADSLLSGLKEKQKEYSREFITLPEIIKTYLRTKCTNIDHKIDKMLATDLHKHLKNEADNYGLSYKYANSKALGMEIDKNKDLYIKEFSMEKCRTKHGIAYSFSLNHND